MKLTITFDDTMKCHCGEPLPVEMMYISLTAASCNVICPKCGREHTHLLAAGRAGLVSLWFSTDRSVYSASSPLIVLEK